MAKKIEKNRLNILVMNLKGGCGKTTTSSIVASFFDNSTLIEIDKINTSDERIDSPYYNGLQMDFNSATSDNWLVFEDKLFENGVKIIDVGAVKLETFHNAMTTNKGYGEIDLIIVPAMDGSDDFIVAEKFLANLKSVGYDTSKVLFVFSRFNPNEYNVEEQYNKFFRNKDLLKDEYKIDLDDDNSYSVIPDKKCVKYARDKGITVRSLVDDDDKALREAIFEAQAEQKRELQERRNCVINAKDLYLNFLESLINKINLKSRA
ncbi:hypothetical protein NG783_10445 [Aliarcobacter cryaerophilus]|uniref:hypothetical protein n=1 Tax=Aliarcobacter cryaerophilus TaxID=28198 RepID=UPI003DA27AB2